MSRQLLVVSTLLTLAVTIQTHAADPGSASNCSSGDPKQDAICASRIAKTSTLLAATKVNKNVVPLKTSMFPNGAQAMDELKSVADKSTPDVDKAAADLEVAEEKVAALRDEQGKAQAAATNSQSNASAAVENLNTLMSQGADPAIVQQASSNSDEAMAAAKSSNQKVQDINSALQQSEANLAAARAKMSEIDKAGDKLDEAFDNALSVCQGANQCDANGNIIGKANNGTDAGNLDLSPNGDPSAKSGQKGGGSSPGSSSGNSNDQNKNANNQNGSGSGSGGSPGSGSGGSSSQSPFQPINMPTAAPDPMQQACAVNPRGSGCPGAPQQNFTPATEADKSASGGNGGGDAGMPSSTPNTPMDRIARQAIYGDQMNNLQNQNQLGLPSAGQNMNDSAGRPGNHVGGSANYAMSPSKSGGGGGSYGGSFGGSNGSGSAGSGAEGGGYNPNSAQSRALAGTNTISPSRVANNLRLALMRYHQRSPSSTASVGRDGITGPNTDLWYKVRNRYYSKSAGLNP